MDGELRPSTRLPREGNRRTARCPEQKRPLPVVHAAMVQTLCRAPHPKSCFSYLPGRELTFQWVLSSAEAKHQDPKPAFSAPSVNVLSFRQREDFHTKSFLKWVVTTGLPNTLQSLPQRMAQDRQQILASFVQLVLAHLWNKTGWPPKAAVLSAQRSAAMWGPALFQKGAQAGQGQLHCTESHCGSGKALLVCLRHSNSSSSSSRDRNCRPDRDREVGQCVKHLDHRASAQASCIMTSLDV